MNISQVEDQIIREIAYGPSKSVTSYNGLIVNGYRFHTKDYGQNKATMNSGVCVRGNIYGENDLDYYGIVEDVLELSYLGNHNKVFILQCHWFDPISGVNVDERYGLVDIKYKSRLRSNEPFILAEQAQQVYYTKYPQRGSRASGEWWAACKVRTKLFMADTLNDEDDGSNEPATIDYYQDDGSIIRTHNVIIEDEVISLFDAHAPMEEVNINDIHKPIDFLDDQFINDNEDTESNESNEDVELYDSDSSSYS